MKTHWTCIIYPYCSSVHFVFSFPAVCYRKLWRCTLDQCCKNHLDLLSATHNWNRIQLILLLATNPEPPPPHTHTHSIKTHCEVTKWSHSQSRTKLKVVTWGFKKWNEHILLYIYAKLCKILQKMMKKLKRPNSLFLQGGVSSAVLKTWKTRKTKMWVTQIFQILYAIQGTTMWNRHWREFSISKNLVRISSENSRSITRNPFSFLVPFCKFKILELVSIREIKKEQILNLSRTTRL